MKYKDRDEVTYKSLIAYENTISFGLIYSREQILEKVETVAIFSPVPMQIYGSSFNLPDSYSKQLAASAHIQSLDLLQS